MAPFAPRRANQLKGILLEECILKLLESSGYRVVDAVGTDPTLSTCAAGLQVCGRGGNHQIDAIADYLVLQPFTYPQRLLVEAKCYAARDVDLETVRNALGVFRDVCEYWTSPPGAGGAIRRRYHYQYAIFATCNFTGPAQRFAYAHDIHLLPLGQSAFFAPISAAVHQAARDLVAGIADLPITLSDIRRTLRSLLRGQGAPDADVLFDDLAPVLAACEVVGQGYLAMAGGVFPLFLVPARNFDPGDLSPFQEVQIGVSDGHWLIRSPESSRVLFTFDLPDALLELYASSGALSRESRVQLKADYFSDLQFVITRGGAPRLVTLRMDQTWFQQARR